MSLQFLNTVSCSAPSFPPPESPRLSKSKKVKRKSRHKSGEHVSRSSRPSSRQVEELLLRETGSGSSSLAPNSPGMGHTKAIQAIHIFLLVISFARKVTEDIVIFFIFQRILPFCSFFFNPTSLDSRVEVFWGAS